MSCIFHEELHFVHSEDKDRDEISSQFIQAAIKLGDVYSLEFAMPFAAHLLAIRCWHLLDQSRDRFLSHLSAMDIPPAWATDSTILSVELIFCNGFGESEHAALLIKDAVALNFPLASLPMVLCRVKRRARRLIRLSERISRLTLAAKAGTCASLQLRREVEAGD